MLEDERLDGWRAIGAHFGRDRSTVMRWAQQRGMPVQAETGAKTRSVYAWRSELDAWKRTRQASAEVSTASPEAAPAAPPRAGRGGPRIALSVLGGCAVLLMLAAVLLILRPTEARDPSRSLPRNPTVRAMFLQARSDWGLGTGESRARAAAELERITHLDPSFAGGFAGLAEADLQAGEEGAFANAAAAERARRAARRALELDPRSATAHRSLAFLAYWWDGDRAVAARQFRSALALDPTDPQSYLWYADALVDNGEFAAALRHYDRARLLEPDSPSIRTERAWALWSAGDEAGGEAELRATVTRAPQNEETHDALSMVALTRGDVAGYVREMGYRARLSGSPPFSAWVEALARTEATAGPSAAMNAVLHHWLGYRSSPWLRTDPWPAYIANLANDRADLLASLRAAEQAHEVWGMVAYQRRIAQRWRHDAEIATLLAHRTPPPMEGAR